eukprot:6181245-Pleurochrysis_carterae.AAC.2
MLLTSQMRLSERRRGRPFALLRATARSGTPTSCSASSPREREIYAFTTAAKTLCRDWCANATVILAQIAAFKSVDLFKRCKYASVSASAPSYLKLLSPAPHAFARAGGHAGIRIRPKPCRYIPHASSGAAAVADDSRVRGRLAHAPARSRPVSVVESQSGRLLYCLDSNRQPRA